MTADWPLSPLVAERRERVSFGLQVFPNDTKIDPSRHLLAAGQLAEELGYDALFLADHPAWRMVAPKRLVRAYFSQRRPHE